MPNHITNIVKVIGTPEQVTAFREAVQGDMEVEPGETETTRALFDFNKIIPTPKKVDQGSVPFGQMTGDHWYYWNINNWGTKWNAYAQMEIAPNVIKFDTAWGTPQPIWEAMGKKFPELEFHVLYADEDIGNNCGHILISHGVFVDTPDLQEGLESEVFANAVKYMGEEPGYKYSTYNYTYQDDGEETENDEATKEKLIAEGKGLIDKLVPGFYQKLLA